VPVPGFEGVGRHPASRGGRRGQCPGRTRGLAAAAAGPYRAEARAGPRPHQSRVRLFANLASERTRVCPGRRAIQHRRECALQFSVKLAERCVVRARGGLSLTASSRPASVPERALHSCWRAGPRRRGEHDKLALSARQARVKDPSRSCCSTRGSTLMVQLYSGSNFRAWTGCDRRPPRRESAFGCLLS
jgi:hypothetical protein